MGVSRDDFGTPLTLLRINFIIINDWGILLASFSKIIIIMYIQEAVSRCLQAVLASMFGVKLTEGVIRRNSIIHNIIIIYYVLDRS